MNSKTPPAGPTPKTVTKESLESLKDAKLREPKVTTSGKKKSVVPSETG